MKEAVMKVIDTLTQEYYQEKCPYEKSLETYLMILVYNYKIDEPKTNWH